jgi:hypothetical protein
VSGGPDTPNVGESRMLAATYTQALLTVNLAADAMAAEATRFLEKHAS